MNKTNEGFNVYSVTEQFRLLLAIGDIYVPLTIITNAYMFLYTICKNLYALRA